MAFSEFIQCLFSNISIKEKLEYVHSTPRNANVSFEYQNKDEILLHWLTETILKQNITSEEDILLWNALNEILPSQSGALTAQSSVLSSTFINRILNDLQELVLAGKVNSEEWDSCILFLHSILQASSSAVNIAFNIDILFQLLKLILQLLHSNSAMNLLRKERIYSLFSLIVDKLTTSFRQHDSTKVVEIILPLLEDTVHFLNMESHKLSFLKEKFAALLKLIFCNSDLHTTYIDIYKRGTWNRSSSEPVEQFLSRLSEMLNDQCKNKRLAVGHFLAVLLSGAVERTKSFSKNTIDYLCLYIFCKLLKVKQLATQSEEQSLVTLMILEELLIVCSGRNTSFTQNPLPEQEIVLLTNLAQILLSYQRPLTEAWLGSFIALFQCSVKLLQKYTVPVLQTCWMSYAKISSQPVRRKYSQLLCQILNKFICLHQLPDLVRNLFTAVDNKEVVCKSFIFAPEFYALFSETVVILPMGQSFEIWKEFLKQERVLLKLKKENKVSAKKIRQISLLFANFLLHFRITESCSQVTSLQEVKSLMTETQLLLKEMVPVFAHSENEEVMAESTMWLSYAWGELHLTLASFCRTYSADFPNNASHVEVFDFSIVHQHLSGADWLDFSNSGNPQKSSYFVMMMLLIQKIRAFYILEKDFADSCQSVRTATSKLIECVLDMQPSGLHSKWNGQILTVRDDSYYPALWSLILKWMPLLIEFITSKQLLSLCTMMIKFLQTQCNKEMNCEGACLTAVTKKFIASDAFAENEVLQTAFLSSLWKHSNDLFGSTKRKGTDENDEIPTELKVLKCLHKHPKLWLEHACSNPPRSGETPSNDMWALLQKAGSLWETAVQSSSGVKVNVQLNDVLQFVEIIDHFPLRGLLPGNQIRCILGLLCLQSLLRTSDRKRLVAYSRIEKCLMSIFDGVRYPWIMSFVQPSVLLQHQMHIGMDTFEENLADEGMTQWTNPFLEKLIACALRKENCGNVEKFTQELGGQKDELKAGSLLFLSTFLKQLMKVITANNHRFEEMKNLWSNVLTQIQSLLEDKVQFYLDGDVFLPTETNIAVLLFDSGQAILENTVSRNRNLPVICKIANLALGVFQQSKIEMVQSASLSFLYSLLAKKEAHALFDAHFWKEMWTSVIQFAKSKQKSATSDVENRNHRNESLCDDTLVALIKDCSEADDMFSQLLDLVNIDDINQVVTSELKIVLKLCTNVIQSDARMQNNSSMKELVVQLVTSGCLLLNQTGTNEHHLLHIAVPFLNFFHLLLGRGMSFLRSHKIIQCLQSCAALPLMEISSNPAVFIKTYTGVCTVINQILLDHKATTVQAVVPIFASLSYLLASILEFCECNKFDAYDVTIQQEIPNLIDMLMRIFTLVVKYKEEFSKSVIFLVSTYISAMERIMLHPKMKAHIVLCIYLLLNICNEYSIGMLQTAASHGGKEIFKVLYSDYNNHYRYKGFV